MTETYAAFRAKLDEVGPLFRQAFEEAVADITSTAQMKALEAAIARGDLQAALRALNLGPEFWAPLDRAMSGAFEAGAIWQLSQTLPKQGRLAGRLQIRFNGRHPRAETWTRQNGARLVTEVAESVKEAVRVTVEDGLAAGRGPRKVALDIAGRLNRATGRREGGIIGLTSQQASYVSDMRAALSADGGLSVGVSRLDENGDPIRKFWLKRDGTLGSVYGTRDRRYDRMILKAIKDGKPLAQIDIDRITARYSDRLLKHRAEVIARTEGLTALNAGRQESIIQMADGGDIPRAAIKREWLSTPDSRTRDSHSGMNRQVVGIDEPFTTASGVRMLFPGDKSLDAPASETIQCRCSFRTRVDWQAVAEAAE